MSRATGSYLMHGRESATSPMLLTRPGEGVLVARVLDHDWGERVGEVAIEQSFDGGLTWPVTLTVAHGVRSDAQGAIWTDYATDADPGPRFVRARAYVPGTLTARLEIEALPVEFPPAVEPHHSVAFVQSVRAGSASASLQDVTLSAPTAGNLLLAYGSIVNASLTVDTCVQNPTGTPVSFTALQATQTGGGANILRDRVFYLAAATTNTTVRVTFSGTAAVGLVVHEYSGHNPTGPIHAYAVAVGSSTTPNSGNITTTQANCMLVGFTKLPSTAATWTPGASYTIRQPPSGSQREASEDRNVSAAGTYAAAFTASGTDDWHCWIVAIQEPVASIWTSLQAYWKMEEASGTRIDNFSGLCNLTDVNTVTQTTGIIGNAAQFTAANSESLTRASDTFIDTGDIDWTINFWIQWATAPGTGFPVPFSKDDGGSNADYVFYWDGGAAPARFKLEVFGGAGRTGVGQVWAASATGSTGVWYMITFDHSATNNEIGIRINGAARTTAATTGAMGASSIAFWMSGRASSLYLNGYLDEVGFWKRSITDAEATALYNAGAGLSFPNAPAAGATPPRFRPTMQAVARRAVR